MAEYTIARLSDGREVKIDIEAVLRDVRKRREFKELIKKMRESQDYYDSVLAKYSGLPVSDIEELDMRDWMAIDTALSKAFEKLNAPN